jgi:hypothetical protein
VSVATLEAYRIGTPEWWVSRLYDRLMARRPEINNFDDYYQGNFPLPWLAPQARTEFRRILKMSRANYTGLVIDAMCERMAIEGFRLNEGDEPPGSEASDSEGDVAKADRDLWRIWQANDLDTYFDQGLLEAAITGTSYLLVEPNREDADTPRIHVEHSAQMIVAYVPGSNRRQRAAALKLWVDEWTGAENATLYLPGWIFKFVARGEQTYPSPVAVEQHGVPSPAVTRPIWGLREVPGEDTPARSGIKVVPVFECPNNPRLLSGGQSELWDLLDTQDRIVKTLADRLMTQDYGAFPQRWASGWPEEDEHGNPTPPIEVGRDRMVTTEVAETKFGQWMPADLAGYLEAKRQDVIDMASRSRTPAQYLLGDMSNVNGETLKASESGLVAKVRQRMRGHNDPLESAMRLVREMAGLATPNDVQMEVIWRNPEFRTQGELVDSLLKMSDLGVPEEMLWEEYGFTPQQVERAKFMLDEKMRRAAAGDATVVLAERFRSAAAGALGEDGTQSGGQSSANAATRRPQAGSRS